jgi:hypothetical protein
MIKTSTFLYLTFYIIVSASCYTPRYVYSPSAHNVPVLLKKGDSKLAFDLSTNFSKKNASDAVVKDNKSSGIDLQGAYAITNKFALQLNYYRRTEKNNGDFSASNLDSSVINYKRNLTEIGVGYYRALLHNRQAIFQVFAGIGFGRFGFTDIGRDQNNVFHNRFHQMDVTKLYVQPAFTIRSKRNFTASLSSRFSVIYFHNIQTDYTVAEQDNYKLDSLNYRPHLFWEPAVINTFGFKRLPGLQLEFQAGLTLLESRLFIDYRSFNFSLGILFDIPKLLKKK